MGVGLRLAEGWDWAGWKVPCKASKSGGTRNIPHPSARPQFRVFSTMFERAAASVTSFLLALLVKYGALLYHALLPQPSTLARLVQTPVASSWPELKEPSSSRRLYVPDLLENWPWRESQNPAFSNSLNDEELAYFLALPEVQRSKGLQVILKKGFVRKSQFPWFQFSLAAA